LVFVGIGIYGINNLRYSWKPLTNTPPKKTTSEVTWVISTIDPNLQEEAPWPWNTVKRWIWVGDTGEDVKRIQQYLSDESYYTGGISGTYDITTANAINTYLKDKTGESFGRPEFWEQKMTALKSLPPSPEKVWNTPLVQTGAWGTPVSPVVATQKSEVSGTLSTQPKPSNITIDGITSLDGKATAVVKDGRITIQVINPEWTTPTTPTPISSVQSGTTTSTSTPTRKYFMEYQNLCLFWSMRGMTQMSRHQRTRCSSKIWYLSESWNNRSECWRVKWDILHHWWKWSQL
jgi:hypothetical protein